MTNDLPLPTPCSQLVPPFEVFDHTADIGIFAFGRTLEELFANAALGMFAQIWEFDPLPELTVSREITAEAPDRELLLQTWLANLLFVHDVEDLLFGKFEISLAAETLAGGRAYGVPMDSAANRLKTQIKAVTYHSLAISETDDGYRATILFDV